ncbi:hypothetical protein D3H55_15425 [Bacillus salacetis]|uniref:Uncharacterized protein n=1 Tax=Bacillus salacetis TaxID=2315464 RepID=A0A3A1QZP7_9BACI|nr:hypothetical protein [Bacillus salacetis]RIW31361.1 hypothetical protein D3H55_15425 [Bacillus salacetis]
MAKIPIKPIIKLAKTHGPRAAKFVKEHGPKIAKGVTAAGSAGKMANDFLKNRKEAKLDPAKVHFRKTRFHQYKTVILPDLPKLNRHELFEAKVEVEQFIGQIKEEEQKEAGVKKPLHSKRLNNWKEVIVQIEARLAAKDYQEYLRIYNNQSYQSEYFKGYEGHLEKFRDILKNQDNEELYEFLVTQTKRSKEDIKVDFSL